MTEMNRGRILVAEDESLIAMQLEDVLRELGFEVVGPVSTVQDVISSVEKDDIEGALLDVNLRGEAVLGVLPRLKDRNLPFIITSGYDAASLFPPEFRNVPRVVKPFDEDELKELCVKMFAKAS
jgi:DNA-binding NtrC family response regulator